MKRTPLKRKTYLRRQWMKRRPKKTSEEDRKFFGMIHARMTRCEIGPLPGDPCRGPSEVHHIAGRLPSVRNHPLNGLKLCAHHHRYSKVCSPHGSPRLFRIWLEQNRPNEYAFAYNSRRTTG